MIRLLSIAAGLVAALLFLGALLQPAGAHFLLNVNIRIVHIEHPGDGLRVYLRLPTPYVLAPLVGEAAADGSVAPAPFTSNRMEEGELLHSLDRAAIEADPLGLGRLVAEGHRLTVDGQPLAPRVEALRVHRALQQSPFATLEEAKASFDGPVMPAEEGEIFAGDSVLDVQLFYPAGGAVYDYRFASTLDPGLEGQEKTANLIIDHFIGEPLVFRQTGLLAEPVAVSRSALAAAWGFVLAGVKHILEGTDHVLFVVCLTIGAVGLGNLLWRVTGFTLGHTVTLIMGFLGYVPTGAWFIPAVEMGIALSIIYAAVIAVLRAPGAGTIAVTAAIGLLHGLGFSFVLQEILRVDAPNLWQSLVAFNVGVELGQIAIVALIWPIMWYLARKGPKPVQVARWAAALPCMVVAGVWTGERGLQLLSAL